MVIANRDSRGLVEVANQSSTLSGGAYVTCDRDIILNSFVLNAKALLSNAVNGTIKADYVAVFLRPTSQRLQKTIGLYLGRPATVSPGAAQSIIMDIILLSRSTH